MKQFLAHSSSNLLLAFIFAVLAMNLGCSRNVDGSLKAPFVYRIDVQQGNVVDQEMLNKLEPGMDRNKVKYIMGTPLIQDPFHSDRWDYVYSMEPGGGERTQRRVTLYFREDKLAYVDGDIAVNPNLQKEDIIVKERSVVVPLEEHEDGFFDRLLGKDGKTRTDDSEVDETELSDEELSVPPVTDDNQKAVENINKDTADEDDNTASADIIEKDTDKNLIRRFWDRMTSGTDESTVQEGVESERDRRDAEILDQAGGEL